jgi:hypothetical protein
MGRKMTKKNQYDDDVISHIDKEMNWIEEDGSCPSKTAEREGYHCKFITGNFMPVTAWIGPDKVWSLCILGPGIKATLLSKSLKNIKRLYIKFLERNSNPEKWQKYYSKMWERNYRKWMCKKPNKCYCQLCRMGE